MCKCKDDPCEIVKEKFVQDQQHVAKNLFKSENKFTFKSFI